MTAMVNPANIAAVMGLRRKVRSLGDLSNAVRDGLPKSALKASVTKSVSGGIGAYRDVVSHYSRGDYKRRRELLKIDESEKTERLARVIATAEHVWDDNDEAKRFLISPHSQLEGQRPIDVALTELGARRVEELLWKLFYGIAA